MISNNKKKILTVIVIAIMISRTKQIENLHNNRIIDWINHLINYWIDDLINYWIDEWNEWKISNNHYEQLDDHIIKPTLHISFYHHKLS